jgi:hypothetical protein
VKYTNKGSYRDVFKYLKLVLLNAMYSPSFGVGIAKKWEKHTIFTIFLFIFHKKQFFGHGGVFFSSECTKIDRDHGNYH